MDELKRRKRKDAFNLFYESVLKPDHELRQDAHEDLCYHELMEWRNEILSYLDRRRVQEFYNHGSTGGNGTHDD